MQQVSCLRPTGFIEKLPGGLSIVLYLAESKPYVRKEYRDSTVTTIAIIITTTTTFMVITATRNKVGTFYVRSSPTCNALHLLKPNRQRLNFSCTV
jgi:hypothetical protein